MNAPKDWIVDVLGKKFSVVWKRPARDAVGQCKTDLCKIFVDPDIGADSQRDTLLHEVVHAIDHDMDTGMRERQVKLLATGLFQFLRANPEIIRWMCERDADTAA